jgi:hypothetical protein
MWGKRIFIPQSFLLCYPKNDFLIVSSALSRFLIMWKLGPGVRTIHRYPDAAMPPGIGDDYGRTLFGISFIIEATSFLASLRLKAAYSSLHLYY